MTVEEQIHAQDPIDPCVTLLQGEVGQYGHTKFCSRHFKITDRKIVDLPDTKLPHDAGRETCRGLCRL